ncbi:MAG: hypothetical protein ACI4AH_04335 [Muribaculaceae bacterium]
MKQIISNDEISMASGNDLKVLQTAYKAWVNGSEMRATRNRNKAFTYGRQWDDLMQDELGNTVSEGENMCNRGCQPITNNLIRQMIKTVIGRYRNRQTSEICDETVKKVYKSCVLDEVDSRALEEFLISGCVVQRIDVESDVFGSNLRVDNVNFNHFFMNNMSDCRAWDDEIVGQLHDLSLADLLRKVSRGNRAHAEAVRRLYTNDVEHRTDEFTALIGTDWQSGTEFWHASGNKWRAIEVWTLESREVLVCHCRSKAQLVVVPYDSDEARAMKADEDVATRWDIAKEWHCRWFSPMGDLLCHYCSEYRHGSHPFAIKMYPLIDGEIHSLVEDVIGQQKFVNRLITMLNHMMKTSAKGVLLFPVDSMPEGFTWRDIRKVWASADGVLPFSERDGDAKPEQIVGNANNLGAYEMINLQMKLFEYVSGVNGSLQGRHQQGTNSTALYESEVGNADIAISDLILTFASFVKMRNRKISLLR